MIGRIYFVEVSKDFKNEELRGKKFIGELKDVGVYDGVLCLGFRGIEGLNGDVYLRITDIVRMIEFKHIG